MRVQVLAIGEIESGKNATTGRVWTRRTFQMFTADQIAGNHVVYGEEEELNSYKAGGTYEAEIKSRAGNRGAIELVITKLTPVKPQ